MYSRRGWSYSSARPLGSRRQPRSNVSGLGVLTLMVGVIALAGGWTWYTFFFSGIAVHGTVVDDVSGQGVAGARVWGTRAETRTSQDGAFDLEPVKPTDLLQVEAAPYASAAVRPIMDWRSLSIALTLPAAPAVVAAGPTDALPAAAPTDQPTAAPAPLPQTADDASSATALPNPVDPLGVSAESIFPRRRIVSYYGNPLSDGMGVLGEGDPADMVARLQDQAQAYADADPDRPVIPALQLVTPVAQADAGLDGLFRLRMEPSLVEQMAELADSHHFLLILDVQVGQSSIQDELPPLLPFLQRPYVQLALDPEFDMSDKASRPGRIIGTTSAADVNDAIQTVSSVVREGHLPPKVLLLHRFLDDMIQDPELIQGTPQVQIVSDMDGFGPPAEKLGRYNDLVRDQPLGFAGVKLFYQQDQPLWTPQDVLGLSPAPDIVIYQ